MVFPLIWGYDAEGKPLPETEMLRAAMQAVRVERQGRRWVVLPQEDFTVLETDEEYGDGGWLRYGDHSFPAAMVYHGETEDFVMELFYQTSHVVDNAIETEHSMSWFMGPTISFDSVPKPAAEFEMMYESDHSTCLFLGDEAERAEVRDFAISYAPLNEDGSRPELHRPEGRYGGGSSSDGSRWEATQVPPDWDGTLRIPGGGNGGPGDVDVVYPEGYAADLYINGELKHAITLFPVEGRAS